MAEFDLLLKALDTAHWEMGEAFKGLPDDDVWRRAHPKLLSIGELAAHVGYWEAQSFIGEFESPLTDGLAKYYTTNVDAPFTKPLGAEQVYDELKRIHQACKAAFLAEPRNPGDKCPTRQDWTWGGLVEYQVFHLSYHTGQMYSVRHLMGHQTVDN